MPSFDPMVIFTVLSALAALAGVASVAITVLRKDKQAERMKAVTERRRALALQTADSMRAKGRAQPKKKKSATQELVEKFKLLQADTARDLKRKMAAAGWRDPSAPAKFMAATLGLPLVLGLLAAINASGPMLANQSTAIRILVPVGAAALGFYLPRILLSNAVQKRRVQIQKSFPDALDLMVICVEAGLSAEAAFNRVTEEMIGAAPELAEEFGLVAAELAFLPDRRMAYENLSERTGMPSMKSLST
ncbi:MAG TPA: type II secretion system F family protein, partial [Candidatus Omnitrophota bacterium]|nr:type II secretion system F family protein [Candidatus Omnitrophota bacterium]